MKVAFGPVMPGFGSWEWVGADTARELSKEWDTLVFDDPTDLPACDVVVFVKFKPSRAILKRIRKRSAVVYCPIDFYGSGTEIDSDAESLLCCDLILLHCEQLKKYFSAYSTVETIDHHLKFTTPHIKPYQEAGPILWVGVRSNLRPLVDWVNSQDLPEELWILTNPEDSQRQPLAHEFGLTSRNRVRVEVWSAERHVEWTELARVAIDVKGQDFRARYKPPTKSLDFLASGVPLAMNVGSSSGRYLHARGFELANPDDRDRWFSPEYWEAVAELAPNLREGLVLTRLADRWRNVLIGVCANQTR